MANIIVIEDDSKITSLIRQYVNELGNEHHLRFFANRDQFENVYLKKPKKNTLNQFSAHPLFQSFTVQQLNWLLEHPCENSIPIPNNIFQLQINQKGDIQNIQWGNSDNNSVFAESKEVFLKKKNIKEIIPESFHTLWDDFMAYLKPRKIISTALPFRKNNHLFWLLKVSAKPIENGLIQLIMRHTPEIFDPLFLSAKKNDPFLSEPASPATPIPTPKQIEELQLLSTIDLIIFRIQPHERSIFIWLESTFQDLKQSHFFPEDSVTRFVGIKYEENDHDLPYLFHSHLDDLIYLPLDRPLFLQKIEIILALPRKIRPSYLFLQEGEFPIEVAHTKQMEKISDVACALSFSQPVTAGMMTRLKFRLPGEKQFIQLLARSFHCVPHPQQKENYLVYYYFFGIERDQLKDLKKILQQQSIFKYFHSEDEEKFAFYAQNLFLTAEEKKIKSIMILDSQPQASESLVQQISNSIHQTKIICESSYYLFLRDWLCDPSLRNPTYTESPNSSEISFLESSDLFAPEVSWIITIENRRLIDLHTKAKENDRILDYSVDHLFHTAQGWMDLFKGRDNESLLNETLGLLSQSPKMIVRKFALSTAAQNLKWAEVKFSSLNNSQKEIIITISSIKMNSPLHKKPERLSSLDLLIVNDEMIPPNVDSWLETIQSLLSQQGIGSTENPVKVLVISDVTKNFGDIQKKYRHTKIDGLQFRPLDNRSFLFQISLLIKSSFTKHQFENQNYLDVNWLTHLTREATMEGLSEFGSSLLTTSPIENGNVLFLHEGIFDQSPQETVAARFYRSEPHPQQKGVFICSFIYYGISDSFLKFCRNWIREKYAARKTKEI